MIKSANGKPCRPRVLIAYHGSKAGQANHKNSPMSCTSSTRRARASARSQLMVATSGPNAATTRMKGRGSMPRMP